MLAELLPLPDAVPIWLLAGLVVAASLWWARAGVAVTRRWQWLTNATIAAALLTTLGATLLPMELPAGFVPPRATFDPLLGFQQILLLDTTVRDAAVSQAWAVGNLFLLWPLAATLRLRLPGKHVLAALTAVIVAIELVQGVAAPLGRTFELSDLVLNLLGATAYLALTHKTFQNRVLSPTMRL